MTHRPMNRPAEPGSPVPRVWVVFGGGAGLWWLRWLRPGFRHCFALLNDGRHWVLVDPMSSCTEVAVLDLPAAFDLPEWFGGRGMTVAAAPVRRGLARPAPWGPFTCVEAVKRLIGLHAPFVLTPWQLYRRLAVAA